MATSYQIITDSSCDLPQELADRYGLIVLPLSLTVDDKTYHNYLDGRLKDQHLRRQPRGVHSGHGAVSPGGS